MWDFEPKGVYFCILTSYFCLEKAAPPARGSSKKLLFVGGGGQKTNFYFRQSGSAAHAPRIGRKYKSPVGDVDLIRLGQ